MAINLTDSLNAATTKGKLGAAEQIYLKGDTKNLQKAQEDNDSHFGALDNRSTQLENAVKDISATGGASTANAVSYSNETSGMTAVTAQGAIDELANKKFNKENIAQEFGDSEDKVMSQKAVSTKLSDLYKGHNKSAQLPFSFEHAYNGSNEYIRTNDFSPCIVYGIIAYTVATGSVVFYSHDVNSNVFEEIEHVEIKNKGLNIIKLSEPFEITKEKKLGYVGNIIGTRKSDDKNVLGMYEIKLSGTNALFYANFEADYGVISSLYLVDALQKLEGTANKTSTFIKTNNALEEINTYFLTNRVRANNFFGTAIGIRIYASEEGNISYGIVNSDFSSTKLGEVHLKKGINDIFLDEEITCGSERQIYISNINAKIGISSSNGVGMWDAGDRNIFNDYELAYWLIQNIGIDRIFNELKNQEFDIDNLKNKVESSLIKTNNPIDTINQYNTGGHIVRANNFIGTAIGIRIYALGDGVVEYGILNIADKNIKKIGDIKVVKGINDYSFSEAIVCDNNEKIYIHTQSYSIGSISTKGVGMYELNNNDIKLYNDWELSYALICNYGIEGQLQNTNSEINKLKSEIDDLKDKELDINYGELILPSKIHVATGTECNLWWSSIANVEEGDKSIYFETVCDIGKNAERGFVIDVADTISSNIGEHSLHIVSRRTIDRKIISDVNVTIVISDKLNGSGNKTIMMLGDSRTWQSFGGTNGTDSFDNFVKRDGKTITAEVKNLVDNNLGSNFTFVGDAVSSLNSLVRNCAISGAVYTYPLQKFKSAGGIKNYVKANGSENGNLDFVTIMYGINDLSDWNRNVIGQYDNSINKIDNIINNAKQLIDVILSSYPNCKIILVIEPTTCASQDGWAYWAGHQTKRHSMNEMEKAQKYLRKILINTFDNRKYNNNVILSSAGLWCDRLYGFPYIIGKVSQRCSSKTKEIFQECVHPFDDGYRQIADGIFGTIKYLLKAEE